MSKIARYLRVKGATSALYGALSTQEGLAGWWTRTCSADASVGGEARFSFRRGEVVFSMRIDALDPNRAVRWTCVENRSMPGWEGTTVSFTLTPKEDGETEISFVHDGWVEETEWFEHTSDGWDYFLKSLKDYVETGTGSPDAGG